MIAYVFFVLVVLIFLLYLSPSLFFHSAISLLHGVNSGGVLALSLSFF